MKRYQLAPMPEPLPSELVERARKVEVATIGHFRHRGFMHGCLRPLAAPAGTLAGTAVTLAIPGPCSTLLHHAIASLRPGDVLLIDRLGDRRHACLGGGVARAIAARGVTAVVLDGPCTDPDEIEATGLPVFCNGVAPVTTRLLDLGGALNHPIACCGVPVLPGDLVLMDATGVLVVPPAEIEATLVEAQRREARTRARQPRIAAGEPLGELSGASAMVRADQEKSDADGR